MAGSRNKSSLGKSARRAPVVPTARKYWRPRLPPMTAPAELLGVRPERPTGPGPGPGQGSLTSAPLVGRLRAIRAHPLLNPTALAQGWREWLRGYPADPEHEPHLAAAIEWLVRAQDATPDGGISRAYSLVRHRHYGRPGWQPSYPETTGYIIPTLYAAARRLGRPELAVRAERAARWEIDIQLPTGAVRGGAIGEPESPAVFNTGRYCSAGSPRSRRPGRTGSPTLPAAPPATWRPRSTPMGIGAGGTRASLALTRRSTIPALPGRWRRPGSAWMITRSPMLPRGACAPPP